MTILLILFFFFFNDTATTEIYTLSLHDALPIYGVLFPFSFSSTFAWSFHTISRSPVAGIRSTDAGDSRSEEHTSELQSRQYLVCRLLLEKKKKKSVIKITRTLVMNNMLISNIII